MDTSVCVCVCVVNSQCGYHGYQPVANRRCGYHAVCSLHDGDRRVVNRRLSYRGDRRVVNSYSLDEHGPLKVLDGLLTELGLDVVRPQPLDHRHVGGEVSEGLDRHGAHLRLIWAELCSI